MRKKKKKKNQIREEALYIREGEEPREKKKKKIKNRKREKIETGVGGFEVSVWDHGWVGWLQIRVGHTAAHARLRPGLRANLGLALWTWVALQPGFARWCGGPVVACSGWIGLWVLLCFKEFLGALKCWCFQEV